VHAGRIVTVGATALALSAILVIATAGSDRASAATLSATPATFRSVFASARPGDRIELASGNYGTFTGALESGEVTLAPQPGARATMALHFSPASNITIDGLTLTEIELSDARTKNITVRNSDIPGQTTLRTGELANASILFDHNVHRDFDVCPNCAEGRVFLPERGREPSGITIQNSEFRGGLSDGISNGSNGTRIINNVFHDLEPGSPDGVHTDAIQLYGSEHTLIKGNYMYRVPQGIMASSGADHEIIEDNVIDPGEYPFPITLWSDDGSIVRHNTFPDGACAFHARCGILTLGSKPSCSEPTECDPGHGTVIKDNVLGEISFGDGHASLAENSHNLVRTASRGAGNITGLPAYVGGTHPATYAGFALAPGSLGVGDAGDGLDRGIRAGGSAPPASSSATVRSLSTLRSIRATGKLRLRVTTTAQGHIRVSGTIRPGRAQSAGRIRLRTVSLGLQRPGTRTATMRVSRAARRSLARVRSARLAAVVKVGAATTSADLTIKR
jgi:hypothetical protein